MIYRFAYMGYHKNKNITVPHNKAIFYSTVSYFHDRCFVYLESELEELDPDLFIMGDMLPFPDGARFWRMASIFHYATPVNAATWQRQGNSKPWIRVAKLRYDKVDCYTFYHYKLQEEGECNCDKYGSIFLLGNFLLSYNEVPMISNAYNNPRTLPENTIGNYPGDIIIDLGLPWQEYPEDRWQPIEVSEVSGN